MQASRSDHRGHEGYDFRGHADTCCAAARCAANNPSVSWCLPKQVRALGLASLMPTVSRRISMTWKRRGARCCSWAAFGVVSVRSLANIHVKKR